MPLAQTTTDSWKVLTGLLAVWPDDASDPLRGLVQQAEAIRDALGELNENARKNLKFGVNHPAVGTEVCDHLGALDQRLSAMQAEQPLACDWVQTWNQKAQELIHRLLERPAPLASPAPELPRPPDAFLSPVPHASSILLETRLNPIDADAVTGFLAELRNSLAAQGGREIHVVVRREED